MIGDEDVVEGIYLMVIIVCLLGLWYIYEYLKGDDDND